MPKPLIFKLFQSDPRKLLAYACTLPDGQLAVAWVGEYKTHGCYPSLEAFQDVQAKIPGRVIEDYVVDFTEYCCNYHVYTFRLVREEDVTGISGTGVVAVGCDFPELGCVMQWITATPSTFWYPNFNTIRVLHGHNGKTKIETDEITFSDRDV